MAQFSFSCKTTLNTVTKKFAVELKIDNCDTPAEARQLAEMLATAFQDHIKSHGGVSVRHDKPTNERPSGLLIPDGVAVVG